MRYSKHVGIIAAIGLVVSCFFSWVYVPSLDVYLSGVNGKANETLNFGKQIVPIIFFATLMIIFFLVPRIWAKRANVLVGAIQLAWAVKNYVLFSICRDGECPEREVGIYVMAIFSTSCFLMSLLPDLNADGKKKAF